MYKFISITLLLFTVVLTSCESNVPQDDALAGKLSPNLVSNPQSLDTSNANQTIAIMTFADSIHNFGRMTEGEIVEYDFDFTNTGTKDLIINEAKGSCGCTVPTYPKEPIKPGEKKNIKVTFNSQGKKGYNEKSVLIMTNATPSVLNLYIQAEVY
jgi:hypothetical protein